MNTVWNRISVAVAAGLLAIAAGHVAEANPSRGGSCTTCHSNSGSGSLTASPNPLSVQLANTGSLTFSVTSLGSSSVSAISVQGLENSALDASIVPGGDNWTHRVDSTYGMSYVSDYITSTGPYTLNLAIGGAATPDTYPITVMLAGDGPVGKAYSPGFNLQVLAASLAGDYNGDGTVDAADYTVWRDGLGTTYSPADYDVWKAHFGQSAGFTAVLVGAATVPEPASLVLLILGAVAIAACRSTRARPGPA